MSIKSKLSLLTSILILAVLTGVGFSLYMAEKYYLIRQIKSNQEQAIQGLAQISKEAFITNDDLLLINYVRFLTRSSALSYSVVTENTGKVRVHSKVELIGTYLNDPVSQKAQKSQTMVRQMFKGPSGPQIDISIPIIIGGVRSGTARVGYSESALALYVEQALQAARLRIIVAVAVALILGLSGAKVLSAVISRPIEILRYGARQIGEGKLDFTLPILTQDELGELAKEFNIMAAKLKELDQMKQDFVSNVTHELRSPLTSIRGYIDFLTRGDAGPLSGKQSEFLITVKNNVTRLGRFIDQLLDVAKIEAHRLEIAPVAVDLQRIAQDMAAFFTPQSRENNITFEINVPSTLPPVWADPEKLEEVFINLLTNAFKFTPKNGKVTLTATDSIENERNVTVSIRDTGIGIPKESQEKIFDKFVQVRQEGQLKSKGTGLGLAIVKGIIEAHNGKIWVESEARAGSNFLFTIPKAME